MKILEWWEGHSRATRNAWILAGGDTFLLLGALLKLPLFTALWHEVLVGPLPDFYDLFARQLIAVVRDISPSAVIVSGGVISYFTAYATLLTIHLVVGYGIGYLFDQLSKSRWWSIICYGATVLVLAVMHVFVAFRATVFF